MTQSHRLYSFCYPLRLLPVQPQWTARFDGAEATTARTHSPKNHKRRCLMAPALADIGTARLLTDGMQRLTAHQLLELIVIFAPWGLDLQPYRTALWYSGRHGNFPLIDVDFPPVALQFGAHSLQEASRARSVEQAVVEGKTEIHHRTYRDGIVLHHHRSFHHSVHTQNACMGLVDNRYRYNCTKDAWIIHDKRTILHILNG